MSEYTSKIPTVPGFYVIRFPTEGGEMVYAMIDWRGFKVEGEAWTVDHPRVYDLDRPQRFWTLTSLSIVEFGARVGP